MDLYDYSFSVEEAVKHVIENAELRATIGKRLLRGDKNLFNLSREGGAPFGAPSFKVLNLAARWLYGERFGEEPKKWDEISSQKKPPVSTQCLF